MLGTGQTGVAGIINLGFSKLLLNNLVDLVGLRTHNSISSLLQLHWELIPPPQAVAGSGRGEPGHPAVTAGGSPQAYYNNYWNNI